MCARIMEAPATAAAAPHKPSCSSCATMLWYSCVRCSSIGFLWGGARLSAPRPPRSNTGQRRGCRQGQQRCAASSRSRCRHQQECSTLPPGTSSQQQHRSQQQPNSTRQKTSSQPSPAASRPSRPIMRLSQRLHHMPSRRTAACWAVGGPTCHGNASQDTGSSDLVIVCDAPVQPPATSS